MAEACGDTAWEARFLEQLAELLEGEEIRAVRVHDKSTISFTLHSGRAVCLYVEGGRRLHLLAYDLVDEDV